ncbi:choice-of-anchor A family protein [Halochromatium glycolicum]|nr:choice-of-anchor A family protein [Halochromatium glycolicum]
MPSTRYLTVLAVLVLQAPALSAMPITLGDAGQFNALILGDMAAYRSDVEGRLAVAGDLQISDYSVGLLLDDSDGGRDDLIVGGDAEISNSRIHHGNAVVGGNATIGTDQDGHETVGFYSDDDPHTLNGSLLEAESIIDFGSLANDLINRSVDWGALESTGETLTEWGNLTFSGDGDLNIFTVSAELFSKGDKSITFDIPDASVALVNVFGEEVELFDTGFFHTALDGGNRQFPDNTPDSRHDGALSNNILFNFVEATTLDLYSVGIKGSILAPHAATRFYNGHIDGNFIVGSFNAGSASQPGTGDQDWDAGQINDYAFSGFVPASSATPIDEPSVDQLVLVGACLLLLMLAGRSRPRKDARAR